MKQLKLISLITCSCILLLSCEQPKTKLPPSDFVYLQNGKFQLNKKPFSPLMLNYAISLREIEDTYTAAPIKDYENPKLFEGQTVDSSLQVLRGHFELIKELGFNSIRLIGFNKISGGENPTIDTYTPKYKALKLDKNYHKIFNCMQEVLDAAAACNLKVMVLLNAPIDNTPLEDFTSALLLHFQNNSTIFSYDFINEPLYFDNHDLPPGKKSRSKTSALKIVKHWKSLMTENAPNQLMTIGFSEPIEVFEWDPSILPVDFVAFHTYHPLRAPNEIYWYSQFIKKPWIIGETSLPADNDSISYKEQHQFLIEVYKRVVNCGGLGLGWWSFQDVSWGGYEHDYTSIMNHEGTTKTKTGNYTIKGGLKPVAKEFIKLKNYQPTKICDCSTNYYNMLGYNNYVLTGKIIDSSSKQGIAGAVIRGWNKSWKVGANTFSNEKGEFSMYSNDPFYHFVFLHQARVS